MPASSSGTAIREYSLVQFQKLPQHSDGSRLFLSKEHLMPDEEISKLHEILSTILDEIRSTKKTSHPEPLHRNTKEDWPFLADIERVYVAHILRHTRGNKQAAARILNVDRKTLDRMIKRHQLDLSELQSEP